MAKNLTKIIDTLLISKEQNLTHTISPFVYVFIALFILCILFSLGKAIYYYYKVSLKSNSASTNNHTDIESDSTPSRPSMSIRQEVNINISDSERLRTQLDRLRKLLIRLNSMKTFSRDTIGDLSAESKSTFYVNPSIAASSDLDTLWSSIDFDDAEQSTIYEDNFQKTPTEKSVSPSISQASLNASEIDLLNNPPMNITSYQGHALNSLSTEFSGQSASSNAMAQILTILESIFSRNRNIEYPLSTHEVKDNLRSELPSKLLNLNASSLPGSRYSTKSQSAVTYPITLDSTSGLIDKKTSSSGQESFHVNKSSITSQYFKFIIPELVSETVADNIATSKSVFRKSSIIESYSKSTSCIPRSIGVKMLNNGSSNFMRDRNSSCTFESADKRKKPSTLVSLDAGPSSAVTLLNSKPRKNEVSSSVTKTLNSSEPFYVIKMINPRQQSSFKTNVPKLPTSSITTLRKSRSVSNILDKKLLSFRSSDVNKIYSSDFICPKLSVDWVSSNSMSSFLMDSSEDKQNSEWHTPTNYEKDNRNGQQNTLAINTSESPSFIDTAPRQISSGEFKLKSALFSKSISPEIKLSSGSFDYLSPIIMSSFTSPDEINWSTPILHDFDTSASPNYPKTCDGDGEYSAVANTWYTPPLATEIQISDEIVTEQKN